MGIPARRGMIGSVVAVVAVVAATLTVPGAVSAVESPVQAQQTVDSLRWAQCPRGLPLRAECAWLRVPRNWAEPETSGHYRIRVIRIKANGQRIGVLSYNTGGPGGEAVDALGDLYSDLPPQVRQRFDVVGFDPRGVGYSQPELAPCPVAAPSFPATGPVDALAVANEYAEMTQAAMAECLELNSAHADNLGTWQVVRDLDALRVALGEDRITFWGMSYGTTIGRVYAQTFPTRVRALLLDGAITPAPSIGGFMRDHIWGPLTGVERMLGALGSPSVKTYARAMRYLEKRTLRLAGGNRLNRWDFTMALVDGAAYQSQWGSIQELLELTRRALNRSAVRAGPVGERLLELVAELTEAPSDVSSDQTLDDPLFQFVNCSDMPDRPTPQQAAAAATEAMRVGGTPYATLPIQEGLGCTGLPTLGQPIRGLTSPMRLPNPPVVINAVADNRTLWLGARRMANMFVGSSMITYDGTQHVSYARVSACITDPGTNYLVHLTRPPRSVACPLAYDG